MTTLLLTRPESDSTTLAALLEEKGIHSVTSPLLTIRHMEAKLPEDFAPAGLIITSRHALDAAKPWRHLPVYVVGEATAQLTSAAGFAHVAPAAADAAALAKSISEAQVQSPLLYLSGEDVRYDFAAALTPIKVERHIVYQADAAPHFTPEGLEALQEGTLEGVVFFSARTAQIFHQLAKEAGITTSRLNAFCLSSAIGDICRNEGDWLNIRITPQPNLDAMVACINRWEITRK